MRNNSSIAGIVRRDPHHASSAKGLRAEAEKSSRTVEGEWHGWMGGENASARAAKNRARITASE